MMHSQSEIDIVTAPPLRPVSARCAGDSMGLLWSFKDISGLPCDSCAACEKKRQLEKVRSSTGIVVVPCTSPTVSCVARLLQTRQVDLSGC